MTDPSGVVGVASGTVDGPSTHLRLIVGNQWKRHNQSTALPLGIAFQMNLAPDVFNSLSYRRHPNTPAAAGTDLFCGGGPLAKHNISETLPGSWLKVHVQG